MIHSKMSLEQVQSLTYTLLVIIVIAITESSQQKVVHFRGGRSGTVTMKGRSPQSVGTFVADFSRGRAMGTVRGRSRAISGLLNPAQSKQLHRSITNTLSTVLNNENRKGMLQSAIKHISRVSGNVPGLPIGTLTGRSLNADSNRKRTKLVSLDGRRNSGTLRGRVSERTNSASQFPAMKSQRRRKGNGKSGRNTARGSRYKEVISGILSNKHSSVSKHNAQRSFDTGFPSHHQPDPLIVAQLVDNHNTVTPSSTNIAPNFFASQPKIVLSKAALKANLIPKIVVGQPQPLLAAPVQPIVMGPSGPLLSPVSNIGATNLLTSLLQSIAHPDSLSQKSLTSLIKKLQVPKQTQGTEKLVLSGGLFGPRIELSPVIHAGTNSVSTENVIKIEEPGRKNPIILKAGGTLEISSGINGQPTFKIMGKNPTPNYRHENDQDDESKKKEIKKKKG